MPDELDEALERVRALHPVADEARWAHALAHCAQSIECSVDGYPELRPAWFRSTVGPVVGRFFLWRGRLGHDVRAEVPGLDRPSESADAALARLEAAVARFRSTEKHAPHLAFGVLKPAMYAAVHALHIRDHVATFD